MNLSDVETIEAIRENLYMLGLSEFTDTSVFDDLNPRNKNLFSTVIKMFKAGIHVCANRIVSIFQPHVRPIVRG